jgi:hypothetical protein
MIFSLRFVACFASGSSLPSHEGDVTGLDPWSQGSVTNGCLLPQDLAGSQICKGERGPQVLPSKCKSVPFSCIQTAQQVPPRAHQTTPERHKILPLLGQHPHGLLVGSSHVNDAHCISCPLYNVYYTRSRQCTAATGP